MYPECECTDENKKKWGKNKRICQTWADSSKKIESACEDEPEKWKLEKFECVHGNQ